MKRLFIYLIIRLTTRHALNAVKIYETIYNVPTKSPAIIKPKAKKLKANDNDTKKQEIIDSLGYLKAKPIKSKRDKGSISMLEGVLATMV